MKSLPTFLLVILLASTLCIHNSFSQSPTNNSRFQRSKESSSFTFGDMLANPLKDGSLVESRVSQMALDAFKNSYKNVTYSKWYRIRLNYLVYFKVNENVSRALYDARGNLVSSFFYGSEKDLPIEVKNIVKMKYPDYSINSTIEVFQFDKQFWVINLDNDKNLLSVGVENGFIQLISRYKKAKQSEHPQPYVQGPPPCISTYGGPYQNAETL